MIKRTKAVRICRYAVLYLVLVVFGLFFLFPFVFMFFKSVMSDLESVGMPYVRFFPTEWHFENYAKVFDADFIRYLDGKYNISEVFSGVSSFLDRFHDVLGI